MGKIQILDKLSKKFKSAPTSEEDAVYILSRIRKILEIDDHPERYSILNFYCNLALHSRIDDHPKKVADMLLRVHKGTDYSNSIINFIDFHAQLQNFLKEYNLPNFYEGYKISDFNKILNAIYSDTPIILKAIEYEIKIGENGVVSGAPVENI